MKALLMRYYALPLGMLLLTTALAKAEDINPKGAYYYGTIYGAGSALCEAENHGALEKGFAREFLGDMVDSLVNDPEVNDVASYIKEAYREMKKEADCKGIL
jgi:hypothetical protein